MTDEKRLKVAPDYEKRGACGKGGNLQRALLKGRGHGIEGPNGRRGVDPAIMYAPYGAQHISEPIEADIYSTLCEPDVYTARGEMIEFKTWPSMGAESKGRIWRGLLWVAALALYTGLACGIAFALFYGMWHTVA